MGSGSHFGRLLLRTQASTASFLMDRSRRRSCQCRLGRQFTKVFRRQFDPAAKFGMFAPHEPLVCVLSGSMRQPTSAGNRSIARLVEHPAGYSNVDEPVMRRILLS